MDHAIQEGGTIGCCQVHKETDGKQKMLVE